MSAAADSHALRVLQKTSTECPSPAASATSGTRRSESRLLSEGATSRTSRRGEWPSSSWASSCSSGWRGRRL